MPIPTTTATNANAHTRSSTAIFVPASSGPALVAPSTTIYCTTTPSSQHRSAAFSPSSHEYSYSYNEDTASTLGASAWGGGLPNGGNNSANNGGKDRSWPPKTPGKLAQILAAQLPPLHEPRYHHAAPMFASLILSSTLAFMSGLDAYLRCGNPGSYKFFSEWTDDDNAAVAEAAGDLYDDAYVDEEGEAEDDDGGDNNRWRRRWLEDEDGGEDEDEFADEDASGDANNQYKEAESCDETFWTVLTPATVVGVAVGFVALCIVAFPRKKTATGQTANTGGNHGDDHSLTSIGSTERHASSYTGPDPYRRLKSRRRHLYQCGQLLLMSCLSLAVWVYGIVFLMLEPRGGYNDNYRSLAAVDGWGRVGDNANLYYSTWASLGLSVAIVYELAGMSVLQWRSTRQAAREVAREERYRMRAPSSAARPMASGNTQACCPTSCDWPINQTASVDSYFETESTKAIEAIETVLDWSTAQVEEEIRDSRATWYNSLYKLRARTGIWVATLIASLIVCASSTRMWKNIIIPAAETLRGRSYYDWYGSTDVCDVFYVMDAAVDNTGNEGEGAHNEEEEYEERYLYEAAGDGGSNGYDTNGVTYDTCTRTELAGTAGLLASILSAVAIVAHSFMRRHAAAVAASADPSRHSVHGSTVLTLPSELALSLLNSLVLGSSAIFVTGVKGPAQSVGNMYYSLWLSFLLSIRITVACLEQMFNVDDEEELMREQANPGPTIMACGTANIEQEGVNPSMRFKVPDYHDAVKKQIVAKVDNTPFKSMAGTDSFREDEDAATVNTINPNERPRRLRRWGSLAVFSSVCAASAWDAGQNVADGITHAQRFMFILPMAVASTCYVIFVMCLSDIAYIFVDDFRVGGAVAIIIFLCWLSNIVVTMHAHTSFAVNSIGEIKFANLYYFSWASIIVAGLQMKSYTTKRLGVKPKSLVLIMWFAIVKVSFVMFGGGLHIWLNIANTCKLRNGEWQNEPLSFCNRTAFSVIVGTAGTVIAFFVMVGRAIRQVTRTQLYVEMILSGMFVLVFGSAAAVITSIGGPGQSVGDLYYSTWLSFLVSIGVCISCYDELFRDNYVRNKHTTKRAPMMIEIPETCTSSTSKTPTTSFRRMD